MFTCVIIHRFHLITQASKPTYLHKLSETSHYLSKAPVSPSNSTIGLPCSSFGIPSPSSSHLLICLSSISAAFWVFSCTFPCDLAGCRSRFRNRRYQVRRRRRAIKRKAIMLPILMPALAPEVRLALLLLLLFWEEVEC